MNKWFIENVIHADNNAITESCLDESQKIWKEKSIHSIIYNTSVVSTYFCGSYLMTCFFSCVCVCVRLCDGQLIFKTRWGASSNNRPTKFKCMNIYNVCTTQKSKCFHVLWAAFQNTREKLWLKGTSNNNGSIYFACVSEKYRSVDTDIKPLHLSLFSIEMSQWNSFSWKNCWFCVQCTQKWVWLYNKNVNDLFRSHFN